MSSRIVAISQMLDSTYPADLDPEAHRWRRCAKVCEEAGEVTEALLGLTGENPRKGVTHDLGHVRKELLDVAVTALGAVAHLDGNRADPMESLAAHIDFVHDRLAAALSALRHHRPLDVVHDAADPLRCRCNAATEAPS